MLTKDEITNVLGRFGLVFTDITNQYDTSHDENDKRFNYILDDKYVLKDETRRDKCVELIRAFLAKSLEV